jgi:hypothetical protein
LRPYYYSSALLDEGKADEAKGHFGALGCGLLIACVQLAPAIARAQQVSDARIADIVRAGQLRVGPHSTEAQRRLERALGVQLVSAHLADDAR